MTFLSIPQIATRLGVSVVTARKITPQLPGAVKISKRLKFREDSLFEHREILHES